MLSLSVEELRVGGNLGGWSAFSSDEIGFMLPLELPNAMIII